MKKQFTLFLLFFFFLFSACTKIVTTDIGSDLIPPIDGVNTKEMYLDIVSNNTKDTITRVATTDDHSLGYINDPVFGQTTASISVQLKPTSFPFSFPVKEDSLYIDSTVMVLSYKGVWGDSTQPLSFRVFEILADGGIDLSKDSAYKTDYTVVSGNELTENKIPRTVIPAALNDSVKPYPFMEAASNQLRIRLSKSYGDSLLHHYDTSTYNNDSLFDLHIKGYKIVPEQSPKSNALLRINLLDTNTKLAIYFRYKDPTTTGKIDTTVRYFRCNQSTCGSSNYITRTRTTEVDTSLPPKGMSNNDSLIFVDANPGIYTRLQIPALDTMANKIIHRAEILMEQVPDLTSNSDTYLTPPNLFIAPFSQDSSRKFGLPHDVQFGSGFVSNQSMLGCYPFKKTDPSTGGSIYAYSFDISRYVQGIITRHEKSYPLILYAPSVRDFIYTSETSPFSAFTGVVASNGSYIPLNAPAFGRVRLGGGGNSIHKMRLHIVYSHVQ